MELTKEYFESYLEQKFDEKLGSLVTKEDLDKNIAKLATKEDLEILKDSNRTLVADVQEIKETVARIDKRDLEDSNSLAKSFVLHDNSIRAIRKDIKKLKLFVKYEEADIG